MTKRLIIGAVLIVLVLVVSTLSINLLSDREKGSEKALVVRAVKKAAVTCYALEGAYPGDIDYLREHYGLQYDQSRYIVTYDAFASNLMPEITVLEREAAE